MKDGILFIYLMKNGLFLKKKHERDQIHLIKYFLYLLCLFLNRSYIYYVNQIERVGFDK